MTHEDLIRGLRAWIAGHDPHVWAAVELLIDHDHWLHNRYFVRACVRISPGTVWIDWQRARDAYNQGLVGSSTQVAVLVTTRSPSGRTATGSPPWTGRTAASSPLPPHTPWR